MAYLRMTVRDPWVVATLVRHVEVTHTTTVTSGTHVTWKWEDQQPTSFIAFTGSSASTADVRFLPYLEERKERIGLNLNVLDWVQARYLR